MEFLSAIASWIAENEALLSGIAASIVIAGVLMSPLGSGLRRFGRAAPASPPAPNEGVTPAPEMVTDRPSIAVVPFETPLEAPDQAALADGLAEDIIAALSRVKAFFVIARSSTFAYRGRTVDAREVSEDLGVRYVLEGSVRRLGERVRVTARLIDAPSRQQAWAESYDRPTEELFALQDELTGAIVTALQPALRKAEAERARRAPPESLGAWAIVNGAWTSLQSDLESADAVDSAVQAARRALDLDPEYALAHAVLGYALGLQQSGPLPGEIIEDSPALVAARRAVALDPDEPLVHHCLGATFANLGRSADAARAYQRCLDLDPNNAQARAALGIGRIFLYGSREALPDIDRALRQSPRDPLAYNWLAYRALASNALGDWQTAAEDARASVALNPSRTAYGALACAAGNLDQLDEAAAALREIRKIDPDFDVGRWSGYTRMLSRDDAAVEAMQAGIRAAEDALARHSEVA